MAHSKQVLLYGTYNRPGLGASGVAPSGLFLTVTNAGVALVGKHVTSDDVTYKASVS